MQWEVVIGLETHVQLSTNSKIFSGAARHFGDEPNVNACVVDLALPGTLPVLNRGAVEKAIRFGLAIKAKVANRSVFDRKNYFYPDLPKGYQISQFELPIVIGGELTFPVHPKKGDPYVKTIHLTRAHLEEDAGKSIHGIIHGHSGIDLNRAGTPLLEIVTEPELRSSAEAVAYARALHALVVWLGISDGNMQEGNFRCDANVSVRPVGSTEFGTRCEIKNLNSFRFLQTLLISGLNVAQQKILLKKALFFYGLLLFIFPGCDLLLDLLYGVMKAVRIHRFQYIIRHTIADRLLSKSKISITAENDNFQIRIFLSCFF